MLCACWGTNRTKSLTFVFFHSVLNGFVLSARRWIFSALSAPSPSPSSVSSTVSRWFGTGTWQRGIPRHRCRFGQGARRPTLTVQGLAAPPIEQNSNLRPCPILQASWCRSRISSHLKVLWAECGSSPPAASFPTVEFYGHRPASGALRCFSNFYEHPRFDSVVRRRGGGRRRTATSCAGHVHRKGHHAVQG